MLPKINIEAPTFVLLCEQSVQLHCTRSIYQFNSFHSNPFSYTPLHNFIRKVNESNAHLPVQPSCVLRTRVWRPWAGLGGLGSELGSLLCRCGGRGSLGGRVPTCSFIRTDGRRRANRPAVSAIFSLRAESINAEPMLHSWKMARRCLAPEAMRFKG